MADAARPASMILGHGDIFAGRVSVRGMTRQCETCEGTMLSFDRADGGIVRMILSPQQLGELADLISSRLCRPHGHCHECRLHSESSHGSPQAEVSSLGPAENVALSSKSSKAADGE